MLETVLKTAAMMVVNLILIHRIDITATDLPEERMEFVLVAVLLEVVEQLDFVAIRLEVRPDIPVNWYDDLALEILRHAQDIDGCHLVLHANRILAKRSESNIDIVILAMFGKINRKVRVTRVVNVAARQKIGREHNFLSGTIDKIDTLITCPGASADEIKNLRTHGVEVIEVIESV